MLRQGHAVDGQALSADWRRVGGRTGGGVELPGVVRFVHPSDGREFDGALERQGRAQGEVGQRRERRRRPRAHLR